MSALALADRLDAPAILAMHAAPLVRSELDVSAMAADAAITGGRRNRRYAATQVLAALDAFAERAGRRSP